MSDYLGRQDKPQTSSGWPKIQLRIDGFEDEAIRDIIKGIANVKITSPIEHDGSSRRFEITAPHEATLEAARRQLLAFTLVTTPPPPPSARIPPPAKIRDSIEDISEAMPLICDFSGAFLENFIGVFNVGARWTDEEKGLLMVSSIDETLFDRAVTYLRSLTKDAEARLEVVLPMQTAAVDVTAQRLLTDVQTSEDILRYLQFEIGCRISKIVDAGRIFWSCSSRNPNLLALFQLRLERTLANPMDLLADVRRRQSEQTHVFVDASEIYGAKDFTVHVDVKNLINLVLSLRSLQRGVVVGSSPGPTSPLWNHWREQRFEVTVLDRVQRAYGVLGEQTVDDVLQSFALNEVYKPFETQHILCLLTGDGNTTFLDVIERALLNNWQVELWSWKASTAKVYSNFKEKYSSCFAIHYLDKFRDVITFKKEQRDDPILAPHPFSTIARKPAAIPREITHEYVIDCLQQFVMPLPQRILNAGQVGQFYAAHPECCEFVQKYRLEGICQHPYAIPRVAWEMNGAVRQIRAFAYTEVSMATVVSLLERFIRTKFSDVGRMTMKDLSKFFSDHRNCRDFVRRVGAEAICNSPEARGVLWWNGREKTISLGSPPAAYSNREVKDVPARFIRKEAVALGGPIPPPLLVKSSKLVPQKQTLVNANDMSELLTCPLTLKVMVDPVITPEGVSFERSAIMEWLLNHNTCPITANPLTPADLRSNYFAKETELRKSLDHEGSAATQPDRWREHVGSATTEPFRRVNYEQSSIQAIKQSRVQDAALGHHDILRVNWLKNYGGTETLVRSTVSLKQKFQPVLDDVPNQFANYLHSCTRSIVEDISQLLSKSGVNCFGIVAEQGLAVTSTLAELVHSLASQQKVSNAFHVRLLSSDGAIDDNECCQRIMKCMGTSTSKDASPRTVIAAIEALPGRVVLLLDDCESIESCRLGALLASLSRRTVVVFASHLSRKVIGNVIPAQIIYELRMEDEEVAALIVKMAPRPITVEELLPAQVFCDLVVAEHSEIEIFQEALKSFSQTEIVRSLNGNPKAACEFASKIGPNPLNESAYFSNPWSPSTRPKREREILLDFGDFT